MYKVNEKTRKLGKQVCEELKGILSKDVTNGFLIGGDSADFIFYVHDNKYDYKQICIKQLKDLPDEDFNEVEFYADCVLKNLKEGEYDKHISNVEERFIIDKLEEYECKNLYVFDNELHSSNSDFPEGIYMPDINILSYNKSENSLYIVAEDEKFNVDLRNETITWLNKEDDDDKGGCLNWSDIPREMKEYIFMDKNFKDNSFCSKQGTIFVRNKLIKKYMYVLEDEEA